MTKSDWDGLGKLLEGVTFTFSKNCCSGLLPPNTCNCWRCRKKRGLDVTEETEAQAERESQQAGSALNLCP